MDPTLSWADHTTVGLGTCMEVDDLSSSLYPPSCPPLTVTTTAPAGTSGGWAHPWALTEDPTCPFGPNASTATETHNDTVQVATIHYRWPAMG
eukprot:gene21054-55236_t